MHKKMMDKKAKWIGALAVVCAFFLYMGAHVCVQAKADSDPKLWQGFAITATAVRTEEPYGLRFKTDVERLTPVLQKYNPDAEYYTNLTFTTAGGQSYSKDVKASVWRPDGSGWNTVLLGIPSSNYVTEITAQSFIKLNETTFYQTEPVTISIAKTAAAAISLGESSEIVSEYIKDVVTGVSLNQAEASLQVGKTLQLTATTTPSGYKAKFSTSNTSVATVDADGTVHAKSTGSATITAAINGRTATCTVTVSPGATTVSALSNFSTSGSLEISSWLDDVFEDERVGAVKFQVKSNRGNTALYTNPSTFRIHLASGYSNSVALTKKDNWQDLSITRGAYEQWKTSGGGISFTAKCSGVFSAQVSFQTFELYLMTDYEESQTLTASEVEALDGLMPDYGNNSYQYDFLGYSSLGSYSDYNGEQEAGLEDYRNLYRVEEYKDAGMTILYLQSEACVSGSSLFNFQTSKMKQVMDYALEAELTKVVVCDYRIVELSMLEESLIGENKKFASEDDLDKQIKYWMDQYVSHGAFYGIQLADEPTYKKLEALGQVYQSIKRLYPDAYIHCNLLPAIANAVENDVVASPSQTLMDQYSGYGENATMLAAWAGYLNDFLDKTGADYIMFDRYPLGASGTISEYLAVMQVAANVAKDRGVSFKFVSQTCGTARVLTEEDLRWLNNMALGFGVDQFGYFTYFARPATDDDGNRIFLDEASFVTVNGEKTDVYYTMREIMAENQKLAKVLLAFSYQKSATYVANNIYNNTLASSCVNDTFTKVQSVDVGGQENALVTELYDSYNDLYMYMIQNLADTWGGTVKATQTVKLTFNTDYQYAIVWKNGEQSVVRLQNNTYVVKQNAGEAVYVIPFNPTPNDNEGFVIDTAQGDNGILFKGENWHHESGLVYDEEQGDNGILFLDKEYWQYS